MRARERATVIATLAMLIVASAACQALLDFRSTEKVDAAPLPDAATTEGSSTPSTFCSALDAAFCDDFDDPLGVDDWIRVIREPITGTELRADESVWRSPPRAMFVDVPATDGGGPAIEAAYRKAPLPAVGASFALTMEVHRDGDPISEIAIAAIRLDHPDARELVLVLGPGGRLSLEQFVAPEERGQLSEVSGSVVERDWTKLQVIVAPPTLRVLVVRGRESLETRLTLRTELSGLAPASMEIGLAYSAQPQAQLAFRIDNVVLSTR